MVEKRKIEIFSAGRAASIEVIGWCDARQVSPMKLRSMT